MKRNLPLTIVVLTFLVSCSTGKLKEENLALQTELDSLSIVLNETETAITTLSEIGELLDTIELQRDMIRMEMVESGVAYDDYVARVEALDNQLENAEIRITELEKSQRSYASLVRKLRKEMDEKDRQIEVLKSIMENFQADNMSMEGTIQLQEAEIMDLELDIQLKEQELQLIEAKVEEMIEVAKMSEADAYFARGTAYEEAANRTRLAPRKKKETLRQALELYQKALEMGHEGAQAKVDELTERVK